MSQNLTDLYVLSSPCPCTNKLVNSLRRRVPTKYSTDIYPCIIFIEYFSNKLQSKQLLHMVQTPVKVLFHCFTNLDINFNT